MYKIVIFCGKLLVKFSKMIIEKSKWVLQYISIENKVLIMAF